jgi:hypothetical protein
MIHYILRMFFPHLDITHKSLSCEIWFLRPILGIWSFKGGTLVDGRIFLSCLAFVLKEGLQLGFAYDFHHDM